MTDKPRRRWLPFSLRTFLLAVTLLGVWLGWQMSIVRERKEMEDWLNEHGWMRYTNIRSDGAPKVQISIIRRWLGDETRDGFAPHIFAERDAPELCRARAAFPEAEFVTDWGI